MVMFCLVGCPNSTSGRVEVYHDYWDNNDAKVVCRMLSYSSSGKYIYSIYYVIVFYFRCYC